MNRPRPPRGKCGVQPLNVPGQIGIARAWDTELTFNLPDYGQAGGNPSQVKPKCASAERSVGGGRNAAAQGGPRAIVQAGERDRVHAVLRLCRKQRTRGPNHR